MPSPIKILHIGLEGGGGWLMGEPKDGVTLYWFAGTQIGLDENDDEKWSEWTTERANNIESALPKKWRSFYPVEINPQFRDYIRDIFYQASPTADHNFNRWKELLG